MAGFGYKTLGFGSGGAAAGPYTEATGGCVADDGDFKVHTFNSPGTFAVSNVGTCFGTVDYLVVAGGGTGGVRMGGGGGAGGFRTNDPSSCSGLTIAKQSYTVTVGSGGARSTDSCVGVESPGNDSTFSTITSAGGGGGGTGCGCPKADDGGSGGGGAGKDGGGSSGPGGDGNTPPTTPSR